MGRKPRALLLLSTAATTVQIHSLYNGITEYCHSLDTLSQHPELPLELCVLLLQCLDLVPQRGILFLFH